VNFQREREEERGGGEGASEGEGGREREGERESLREGPWSEERVNDVRLPLSLAG
jgi:hypothetical protein